MDRVKLVLISMDSTLWSNLTVGMPIDLLVYRADGFGVALWRPDWLGRSPPDSGTPCVVARRR